VVSRKNYIGRFAFTLIELIFAIVVMSIAVMSLPMMTQITSKGIEDNIVQEAIFAASAELTAATSYYWDERSMEDFSVSRLERVVNVDGSGDCNITTKQRPGHVNRMCLDSSDSSGVNYTTLSNSTIPNLNSNVHGSKLVFTDNIKDESGYKNDYNSTVTISKGLNDNNIKKITITILNGDGNITILNTYSANIGEIDYYKRSF
jgi:prepilin-type N-terminal cleavage/methylation domain-containing protein